MRLRGAMAQEGWEGPGGLRRRRFRIVVGFVILIVAYESIVSEMSR